MLGGVTRDGFSGGGHHDDEDRDQAEDEVLPDRGTGPTSRMRDWVQAFTLPFELIIATILGLLTAPVALLVVGNSDPILRWNVVVIVLVVGVLSVFGALWAQFAGIHFDATRDKLIFPTYSIRRTISLSEISDANSEFVSGGTILGRIFGNMARASGNYKGKQARMYVVNLSGEFGSRQVRFLSKRRRDQFLSLLRRYAPHARITRFGAWS